MKRLCLLKLLLVAVLSVIHAQEEIRLLVRADDMGLSHDINLAIIKAHREGIVTSASIMPPAAYYEEAVRLCKENPSLAVGLHLTVLGTRQRPVLSPEEVPSIVTPQGFFYENQEQLENARPRESELEKEIRAQIGKARASGLSFVYLEEHRGTPPVVTRIIQKICREERLIYGEGEEINGYIRVKLQPAAVVTGHTLPDGHVVHYAAPPYSDEVRQSFFDTLNGLQPGRWWSKSHPGLYATKADLTELLCDPRTLEIIREKNIRLVSFRDLREEEFGKKTLK